MFGSLNTDIKDDDTNCLATFSYRICVDE